MKVSANQQFLGSQVTLSTLADLGDAGNPLTTGTLTGVSPITYNPNPVTPSLGSGVTVNLTNMVTLGAPTGIYTVWVQGQAGAPYLTTKLRADPDQGRHGESRLRDHRGCEHPHGNQRRRPRLGHAQPEANRARPTVRTSTCRSTDRSRPASARPPSARRQSRRRTAAARTPPSRSTPGRWRPAATASSSGRPA